LIKITPLRKHTVNDSLNQLNISRNTMTMCFYRDRQHFSFFKRLKNIKIVVSLQDVLTGK